MRSIPLNLMTLYADLRQSLELADTPAASIATKTVRKKKYVYVTTKDGSARVEKYLGPADDPKVQEKVERFRHAAERTKSLRTTVSLLKQGGFPAPSLVLGRILEVVANAGLFNRGVTLVGTAAFQTYAGILGYYAPTATLMTNDADLSLAEFVAGSEEEDIGNILKRADPSFDPIWHVDDKLPKAFRASNGFTVDLITAYGRGRKSPVLIESLGCAAVPLTFQEFPAAQTINTVALYGSGVLVRVPTPLRYAVHKLLVAQRRKSTDLAKKQKDLRQARELIDIYLQIDEGALQDELDAARSVGRGWQAAINASLKEIGRDARQGRLPLPVKPAPSRVSSRKGK
jgi:hypothetical protein